VRQTHQSMINSKQYQANIALRTTQLNQAQTDLKRRVVLGQLDAIGREELQHAHDAVDSAKAQLDVAQQQYNANQAVVLNTPLDQQPQVLQAAAQVRDAWLSLQRTKIVSPVDGFVSRRAVQVGQRITPATAMMAVVPATNVWVDANFPDIVAQRELVESYSQQIAVAKKDFYPSLSISAFGGFSTTNYGPTHPNFFEAASQAWNIAPAISLPIFHAGALRSKLGEKSALYDEAVESYNQTILNAVQQTADAITIQKSSAEQLQLASSAVQALKDAYRVMSDRYQAGTVGRDQLLDRQSQLLQQQQAEITASSNLLQAKISLIRALGGGYQAPAAESKS